MRELSGLYQIGPLRAFVISGSPRTSKRWLFVGSESRARIEAAKIGMKLGVTCKTQEVSRHL